MSTTAGPTVSFLKGCIEPWFGSSSWIQGPWGWSAVLLESQQSVGARHGSSHSNSTARTLLFLRSRITKFDGSSCVLERPRVCAAWISFNGAFFTCL